MEDLKQAYLTMGLEPFVDKSEVERKYSTFLKKHKARTKLGDDQHLSESNEPTFDEVTAAYKAILAYEDKKYTEAFEAEEYGKFKNLAEPVKKIDHFWRYYKIHTIAALAVIALLVYAVNSYIDKKEYEAYLATLPPVDVEVTFLGEFIEFDTKDEMKAVNEKFLSDYSQFKRVESSILFVPTDETQQMAYLQKAHILLTAEHPDIYIMNRDRFEWVKDQALLIPLNDIPELSEYIDSSYALTGKTGDDYVDRVNAFDITKSSLAQDLPLYYSELIIGIRENAENKDKAIQLIKTYLDSMP